MAVYYPVLFSTSQILAFFADFLPKMQEWSCLYCKILYVMFSSKLDCNRTQCILLLIQGCQLYERNQCQILPEILSYLKLCKILNQEQCVQTKLATLIFTRCITTYSHTIVIGEKKIKQNAVKKKSILFQRFLKVNQSLFTSHCKCFYYKYISLSRYVVDLRYVTCILNTKQQYMCSEKLFTILVSLRKWVMTKEKCHFQRADF